jgi:hypothetical protein
VVLGAECIGARMRESAAATLTILEPPSVHYSAEWTHAFGDFALGARLGVIVALIVASRVQSNYAF